MDLAPMIGRFVCWVFAWAVLGAAVVGFIAAKYPYELAPADNYLTTRMTVLCGAVAGAVVGAMGGSAYEIVRAITANRNRS